VLITNSKGGVTSGPSPQDAAALLTRGSPAVRAVLRAGQGDECQRDGQALGPPQIDHESPGWRPWGPGRPEGRLRDQARSGELEARSSKATAGPDVLRGEFVRVRESA